MILNIPPTLSQIRAGNLRVPLQFDADLTSQYDSAKTQILSNGTSGVNLLLGVSTSGFILLKSGITNLFAAGSAQGVQNQNSWGVGVYGCNVGGSSYSGFSSTGLSDILGNVPTGSSYKLFVQGVEKYRLGAALCELDRISLGGVIGSSVDPGAGSIGLTNRVQFTGAGTADVTKSLIYADSANGSIFCTVPSTKAVLFYNAGSPVAQVLSSGIYLYKSMTFGNAGAASPGESYIRSDAANVGNLHYDTGTAFAHKFEIQNSLRAQIDNNGLTVSAGNLILTGVGQKVAVSTKTTTYTATSADYIILGNHASTPFTINLPAATGSGQVFIIKNINTAAVTVDANASETIDGSLTQVLATNNSITIVDYATGLWAII